MRLYKLVSFFLVLVCGVGLGSSMVFAKEISVAVKLVDIKAERTSEKNGDELYFDIAQYPTSGKSKDERIPIYPLHWVSNQVSQLKNVVLWKGNLPEEASIRLIFSLTEQDFPPWDVDNLLGAAQLVLSNEKGKLKQEWSLPNFQKPEDVEFQKGGTPQHYVFKGDGSRYDVAFQVEQQ